MPMPNAPLSLALLSFFAIARPSTAEISSPEEIMKVMEASKLTYELGVPGPVNTQRPK
jgi:hypothetical protein